MINLLQYLCPQRHCIMAMAYDPANTTPGQAEAILRAQLDDLKVDPWCGICGSSELKMEHGRTRFKIMAEATLELAKTELLNDIARAVLAKNPKL